MYNTYDPTIYLAVSFASLYVLLAYGSVALMGWLRTIPLVIILLGLNTVFLPLPKYVPVQVALHNITGNTVIYKLPDGSQVTFNLKKEYSYSQTTTLYKRVN